MIVVAPRKDPRNFGSAFDQTLPPEPTFAVRVAAGRYSVVMPERVLLALLRTEADRLADPKNVDLLRGFFEHFFDPMIGQRERETYVQNFQRSPPSTVLGYPRTATDFPCIACVLERDVQAEEAVGQYLGETTAGETDDHAREYIGAMYDKTYGLYVYAEHPDVCLYLYHFAKAVVMGSFAVIAELGILDPHYEGGDLQPQPEYLPENMFVRRLGITVKSLETVPAFMSPDPARVRVAGIFAHDVVVSGMRGGVKVPGEDC